MIAAGFYGPRPFADARLKTAANVAVITVWLAAVAHAALDSRQQRGPGRWLVMPLLVRGSFPARIVNFLYVVLAQRDRASSGTGDRITATAPDADRS